MNTLLKLYPPAWRRRYGDEIAQVLSEGPLSPAIVFDLSRGIVDAWLHPSLARTAPARRLWIRQVLLTMAIAVSVARPQLTQARGNRNLHLGPSIGA